MNLAEGRLKPRPPMAQQRRHNFLPLPAAPSFLAKQESSSFAVEPLRGAPPIASGQSITIEATMDGLAARLGEGHDHGKASTAVSQLLGGLVSVDFRRSQRIEPTAVEDDVIHVCWFR
ncbi:hypothetical protein [Bradyrhizobium sp. B120]|uniref:hypothetical protein n=1 Tax=Bradyrhizobium sp. B120 TaxID=3410088 RepID=UPI003B980075